jgi:hypothetical protein
MKLCKSCKWYSPDELVSKMSPRFHAYSRCAHQSAKMGSGKQEYATVFRNAECGSDNPKYFEKK